MCISVPLAKCFTNAVSHYFHAVRHITSDVIYSNRYISPISNDLVSHKNADEGIDVFGKS